MTTGGLRNQKWDAFISHAVDDQASFVHGLAETLTRLGLSIWYAETALQVGDSLSASIDKGLANSSYGIVVISHCFIAKRWTNWELRALVNRQNSEEQNVILPIWHGVSKRDVINFSPSLSDLIALNTATDEADEIAFKLLRVIRPDIYNRSDRAQLKKLASGEAMRELQAQIEQTREELEAAEAELTQYKCPYCAAPLASRNDAPLDDSQNDWGIIEHFECGYSHFEGQVQRPCPSDPKFPKFEDYELQFSESKKEPTWKWKCIALGKTPMARLLFISHGLGRSQEEAAAKVKESYTYYAKRYR